MPQSKGSGMGMPVRIAVLFLGLLMTHSITLAGGELRAAMFPMQYAPFPLKRNIIDSGVPFFNVTENGRRGHLSPRGGVYWEDETYSDNRVLLTLTEKFNEDNHPFIVVYLHGNLTRLERDVIERQLIPQQVSDSGINALLLAPQLAVDALDSNAGNFVDQDFFTGFINEAIDTAARWQGDDRLALKLAKAPILLIAYSGGYMPAAFALDKGGMADRIKGVILLDALYSHEDKFATWLNANWRSSFFISAYTQSTRELNEKLQWMLRSECISYEYRKPENPELGQAYFLDLGDNIDHHELPLQAWSDYPIRDILSRVRKIDFEADGSGGESSSRDKRKCPD